MYVARLIVVLFLILAMVLTYSPIVRGEVSQAWETARPGVILFMDGVYAVIRTLVTGTDPHNGIDDNAPDVDFDEVITMERGASL
jgi:hypothetical protein